MEASETLAECGDLPRRDLDTTVEALDLEVLKDR